MKYIDTAIPDVKILEPNVFGDDRGYFMETYRENDFNEHCVERKFVQENQSRSKQGILRGLHYQLQQPQGKLVRVIRGTVYDVAVDIRLGSETFGQWVAVELSGENKRQLWVPEGFAHGFYVMSDEAEFVYRCTDYYAPEYERSIRWDDPTLNISWPLVNGQAPLVSEKDAQGDRWEDAEFYK